MNEVERLHEDIAREAQAAQDLQAEVERWIKRTEVAEDQTRRERAEVERLREELEALQRRALGAEARADLAERLRGERDEAQAEAAAGRELAEAVWRIAIHTCDLPVDDCREFKKLRDALARYRKQVDE